MAQPVRKPLPCAAGIPYVLVPLHQYPEFTFPCASLLNLEWPRSRQSRLNGLWSCSRQFPIGMVLVECNLRQAVGFCKVSLIPGVSRACFIQSVVIHPEKRGQGLGSFLMKSAEEYLRCRKLRTLYLSTNGQEKFYSKLGYAECEPVSLYAFGLQSNFGKQDGEHGSKISHSEVPDINSNLKNTCDNDAHVSKSHNDSQSSTAATSRNIMQSLPRPPPPPPLPAISLSAMTIKTFMKKDIA